MSRGQLARNRRAKRRTLNRGEQQGVESALALTSVEEETIDEQETLAMTGVCATCDHAAASHEGDENDGACAMVGCDCEAMVEAGSEAAVDAAAKKKKKGYEEATTISTTAMEVTVVTDTAGGTEITTSGGTTGLTENTTAELEVVSTLPEMRESPAAPVVTVSGGSNRWTATLAPEGRATDDGRVFAPGSITWRELPLTLMAMVETAEGHDGAQVCGRIDEIWREEETGLIRGSGEFDSGEYGSEIARLVNDQTLRGVSVDIAISEMEIGYRDEVVDDAGLWVEKDDNEDGRPDPTMEDILFGDTEAEVIFIVRQGVIGAATVCPFPAFADANIEVGQSLVASVQAPMVWTVNGQGGFVTVTTATSHTGTLSLTASALEAGLVPEHPPAEWFGDPSFDELTPLTVDDDGRVYGHAAAWDSCHIGIPGVCTTAPHSKSEYAYFHLKEIACDDGSRIACGTITLDAPHAAQSLGRAAASAHYDHTGTATADVVVGEDEYGIWIAGALRPDVDVAHARKLRGAALSGDWRDVNGNLELVGLLAVNVPGFPVPRARALVAAGDEGAKVLTLTAAGVHADGHVHGIAASRLTEAEDAQMGVLRDIASGEYAALAAAALEETE